MGHDRSFLWCRPGHLRPSGLSGGTSAIRAYDQACPIDGHNTKAPVQTASWCSKATRYRSLERAKRTRESTRQRGAYPQSFHPTMRELRITPFLLRLAPVLGPQAQQSLCWSLGSYEGNNRTHCLRLFAVKSVRGIHASSINGYRKISRRTYCSITGPSPILRASQG